MVLRQGVLVTDVGVVHTVQRHVHAADAQHGVVKVIAVEHGVVKVLARHAVAQDLGVLVAQVFAGCHQKAAGATGGVTNGVFGGGGGQRHHELDQVARRAELAVLPGAGNFAQHVLVHIALGVAVFHGHVVQHVHHLVQQGRGGDGEAGVLHVLRVGGAVASGAAHAGAQNRSSRRRRNSR